MSRTAVAVTNEQRCQRACRILARNTEALIAELDPTHPGTQDLDELARFLRQAGGLPGPTRDAPRPRLHLVRGSREASVR